MLAEHALKHMHVCHLYTYVYLLACTDTHARTVYMQYAFYFTSLLYVRTYL